METTQRQSTCQSSDCHEQDNISLDPSRKKILREILLVDSPDSLRSTKQGHHDGNWEILPGELQDKVVACLPLHNAIQFQSVSKTFQDILSRSSFLQPRSHHFPTEGKFTPTVFFIDSAKSGWHWVGFDIISKKWSRLPSLSSLATPDADLFKEFLVVGSGGLLCVNISKQPDKEQLVVCNPLTQTTRAIPPMNFPRQPVVMHIILDKDTNNYKLIVAGSATIGSGELSRKTEVYDSTTCAWEVTGHVPGPEYALNEYQTGAFAEGVLYCVGFLDGGNVATQGVLAYHVESGEWIHNWRCTLPSLQCCQHVTPSNNTQIFESEGSIFLYWEQEHSRTVVHSCIAKLEAPVDMSQYHSSVDYTPTHDSPLWSVQVNESSSASKGLSIYPEYIGVGNGPGKVCIFNTLNLTGSVHKVGDGPTTSPPPPLDPMPESIRQGLVSSSVNSSGNETNGSGSSNNSGKTIFFALNPLSFSFEPSFHTPV